MNLYDQVSLVQSCTCGCELCQGYRGEIVFISKYLIIVHWWNDKPCKIKKKTVKHREHYSWFLQEQFTQLTHAADKVST